MRVAVTGGTGVVGTALVKHLIEAGHQVRGLARSEPAVDAFTALEVEPVLGDLADAESVERLVDGADWVFHVAGLNLLCPLDPDQLWLSNVAGTQTVLEACRRKGVGRLIHTSSAVTVGETQGSVGDENTTHRGSFLSHYERSKFESEKLVLGGDQDLDVVVVNPSSVQGPGRSSGTGQLLLAAVKHNFPLVSDFTFSTVDIDDCARGHLLAAEMGRAGQRYILSGATLSTIDALGMIGAITGVEPRFRLLRPSAVRAVGGIAGVAFQIARRQPPVCAETVRVLLHGHRYDGSRATRDLGLNYAPIEETLRRTVEWFEAEGLLD